MEPNRAALRPTGMWQLPVARLALVPIVLVVLMASTSCTADTARPGAPAEAAEPAEPAEPAAVDVPTGCVPDAGGPASALGGAPVWVRFCPGPRGRTAPAEVPSDALTSHLELLAQLRRAGGPAGQGSAAVPRQEDEVADCRPTFGRTFRAQIGYADGRVATLVGRTDPDCVSRVRGAGAGAKVAGPEGLGVYGLLMQAFGRQYADRFEPIEASAAEAPLTCPEDPRRPDSVDVDGPSRALRTGFHLGRRSPMLMPLTAERGIVCTWPYGEEDAAPSVRGLTAEEAERVRIGMHAVHGAVADCQPRPEPTTTAVVEDRTGTRRAVTVIDSECATVARSDDGYGLGFAWLER